MLKRGGRGSLKLKSDKEGSEVFSVAFKGASVEELVVLGLHTMAT